MSKLSYDENAIFRLGLIENVSERTAAADELITTPSFDVDAAIEWLHTHWHGDSPMECRRAWEALEAAKHRRA